MFDVTRVIMSEYLLIFEILLVLLGTRYLFIRDRLAGLYFLFLGVYAIPAQIGYLYLPELSELIQAYFGESVWTPATTLIITSLIAFLIFFRLSRDAILTAIPVFVNVKLSARPKLGAFAGLTIAACLLSYEATYLLFNSADISWQTAQDDDITGNNLGYFLFIFFFKQTVAICLTLYSIHRQNPPHIPRSIVRILLIGSFTLFLITAAKLGNRTDLVALTLGIIAYETANSRIDAKFMIRCAIALLFVLLLLLAVEVGRTQNEQEATGLTVALLTKDYYAPAHMLFAAMSFDFIQPLEVIKSNTANALIKLDVPYLQATITELFRPDVATRSAGYAFYVFTEGYMFMGQLGFIYNATIPALGLIFWRKIASSNSRNFNLFMLALLGSMIVNVVRGQTSYFLKYLYTFALPGTLLYCSIMGQKISLKITNRRMQPSNASAVF